MYDCSRAAAPRAVAAAPPSPHQNVACSARTQRRMAPARTGGPTRAHERGLSPAHRERRLPPTRPPRACAPTRRRAPARAATTSRNLVRSLDEVEPGRFDRVGAEGIRSAAQRLLELLISQCGRRGDDADERVRCGQRAAHATPEFARVRTTGEDDG
eukprot:6653133-Prymnesium_polylepis.1